MRSQWIISLACLVSWIGCTPSTAPPRPEGLSLLRTEFVSPPIAARPRGLWGWLNGNVDLPQITRELEAAKAKGMGGFDMWDVGMIVDPDSVVPAGPPFLSPPSLQAIAHAVREAERLDLELGLILSSSWNAGGHWIPPQYGAMGLFRSHVPVSGPTVFAGKIPFPTLPHPWP